MCVGGGGGYCPVRSVHVHMSVYCLSTAQHRAFSAMRVCWIGKGVDVRLTLSQHSPATRALRGLVHLCVTAAVGVIRPIVFDSRDGSGTL